MAKERPLTEFQLGMLAGAGETARLVYSVLQAEDGGAADEAEATPSAILRAVADLLPSLVKAAEAKGQAATGDKPMARNAAASERYACAAMQVRECGDLLRLAVKLYARGTIGYYDAACERLEAAAASEVITTQAATTGRAKLSLHLSVAASIAPLVTEMATSYQAAVKKAGEALRKDDAS